MKVTSLYYTNFDQMPAILAAPHSKLVNLNERTLPRFSRVSLKLSGINYRKRVVK